jgi:hypothetical protein
LETIMRVDRIRLLAAAVAGVFAVAGAARAQVAGELILPANNDGAWSATAGRTVGAGNGVVHGEVGWPGIGIEFLKGLDERTDLGFHAQFLYGFEGTTNGLVGLNLAIPYRRGLYTDNRLSITGRIEPGVSFYGNRGPDTGNVFGVGGPVGAVLGYRLDDRLTLDAGGDINTLISFSNPAGVIFGPAIGLGAEYKLDKDVAITFRSRFGPEFAIVNGGSGSQLGFQTLLGVAYNTR